MVETSGEPKLFEDAARGPDGFVYRDNFITEAEEQELIHAIQEIHLEPFKYYQFTGKRRTASFGWEYEFGARGITPTDEIPPVFLPYRARAANLFKLEPESLAQLSIIEYSVGAPIGWHRDVHHFGMVVGISLGAACRMRFRKYRRTGEKNRNRDEVLSVELLPRSVYLLSDAARETWQHSIPPVKEFRYAIMIRTVRGKH